MVCSRATWAPTRGPATGDATGIACLYPVPMSRGRIAPLADSVLDRVGVEIVDGTLAPGKAFTLQDLTDRFDVSRTVARETMRSLEDLRLVEARPRIGIRVLPRDRWNVFSPKVISWQLRSARHDTQLRTLTELRAAVEPMAAMHAAERATDVQRGRLVELADLLNELGSSGRGDQQEFLDADIEFHTLLLEASGNDMFASLSDAIAEVLIGRTNLGLQPAHPQGEALHRHVELARAVSAGDGAAAELHSRGLVVEVREALKDI